VVAAVHAAAHGHRLGHRHVLGGMEAPTSAPTSAASLRARKLGKLEQRYLRTLHLTDDASPEDIKTKYKDLVKQHHPDANGGDRGSEDKLREVIQAYNYLKQAGLC
ncbi:MAG: DnaJ domain-containing protein, partial [Pseudomonadota bacterium]